MKIHLFEDFKQDTGTSIRQRYPGSQDSYVSLNEQGLNMTKPLLWSVANYLETGAKLVGDSNYHFLLNYDNVGPLTSARAEIQHSFFNLFRLVAPTANNLQLRSRNQASINTGYTIDRNTLKQIYVAMDIVGRTITLIVNGEPVLSRFAIPANWDVSPVQSENSSRILINSTTSAPDGSKATFLPDTLTSIIVASDIPYGQMLDPINTRIVPATLQAVNPIGVEYSDQGFVQDVSKANPLETEPSVYADNDGSIEYVWDEPSNVMATKIYGATRSESGQNLYINGRTVVPSISQTIVPVFTDSGNIATVEVKDQTALELVLSPTAANTTFSPRFEDASNVRIDWGDGTSQTVGSGVRADKVYASAGTYTVKITGKCSSIGLASPNITHVNDWGSLGFNHFTFWKRSATGDPEIRSTRLVGVPDYLPPSVTSLYEAFAYCSAFDDPAIDGWITTSLFTIARAFLASGATLRCGDWDVSNVNDMTSAFASSNFNGPIENWSTQKVADMGPTFYNNPAFSRDLSKWCVRWITSEPTNFSNGAPLLTKKPVWGTCPAP